MEEVQNIKGMGLVGITKCRKKIKLQNPVSHCNSYGDEFFSESVDINTKKTSVRQIRRKLPSEIEEDKYIQLGEIEVGYGNVVKFGYILWEKRK